MKKPPRYTGTNAKDRDRYLHEVAEWFVDNGHTLAGEDLHRVADLIHVNRESLKKDASDLRHEVAELEDRAFAHVR